MGNLSCSNPPVAGLSAVPTSGNAPLNVNFTATGTIPTGGCGTINSYIFDFGDGSPQVTQATPTISHTYSGCGVTYPARVRVTSTSGLTSAFAQVNITMGSCGPPQLVSVVSRKVHGLAGQKDILLPLAGTRGVECRTPGNTGTTGVDYKVVFTFLNNVTNCGTNGTGVTGSVFTGPNTNQCTLDLTGPPDQQYTTMSLNGVTDAVGNSGNVIGPQMGLLVGDVNANGLVNATDTSQVQAQSGQPVTGDLGSGNYRKDVNANGLINATDTSTVQSKSGHGLPTLP
jgi:PKD repeat protein